MARDQVLAVFETVGSFGFKLFQSNLLFHGLVLLKSNTEVQENSEDDGDGLNGVELLMEPFNISDIFELSKGVDSSLSARLYVSKSLGIAILDVLRIEGQSN